MGSTKHAVDTRTFERLRSRRLLIVDSRVDRGEALALALRRSGASAVALSPDFADYAAAHALDVEAMLVNEDELEACRPLVIALRCHPRTRWATVLPVSFSALWPDGAEQPDVAAIADEVNRHVASLMELSVRAKGKLPYETALEPIGPNRILRVLDNTGRKLRVVLSDARICAELELGEQRVSRVRAVLSDDARPLVDIEALAALLALQSGRVRIEEGSEPRHAGWKATLPAALEAAAALAWEGATGAEEPPASSGVRPAVSARSSALGSAPAPPRAVRPTVPQITVAEAWNEDDDPIAGDIDADGSFEDAQRPSSRPTVEVTAAPPSVPPVSAAPSPALAAKRARHGRKARVAAIAIALAAASASLAALFWASHPAWPSFAAQRAAAPRALPPYARVVPAAEAATQPAAAAQTEAASEAGAPVAVAPPAPRQPSASELERARSITLRGHHYLRADHRKTAATAYLKALAIAPDYVPAITPLVRIYLELGNAPEALHWAARLVTLDPEDATAQLLLGDAHALSGDQTNAVEAWRRASALGSKAAAKRLAPR